MLTLAQKLSLCWKIARHKPGSMERYADKEMNFAFGPFDGDKYNDGIRQAVHEIMLVFAVQGHSGTSASMVTSIVRKFMEFKPLTVLTGADDEWMFVHNEDGQLTFQNVRNPRVFKVHNEHTGEERAYDIDGIVWREEDGTAYTNRHSRVDITFPCLPETIYKEAKYDPARGIEAEADSSRRET